MSNDNTKVTVSTRTFFVLFQLHFGFFYNYRENIDTFKISFVL